MIIAQIILENETDADLTTGNKVTQRYDIKLWWKNAESET